MSNPSPADRSSTSQRRPAALDSALTMLLVHQRSRWQRGERVLVEAFLAQQPHLKSNTEAMLDLIGNELILRQERGEKPQLTEYLSRFPQLAPALQKQFEVEAALASTSLPGATVSQASQQDSQVTAPAPPGDGVKTAKVAPQLTGYEILSELGRGGMGVVYKARQLGLNRVVALKMILAGGHASMHDQVRFRTEAEAVARMQHPNIVQIHDIGERENKPYCALEFVDGGSLAQKLNGTPLPPRQAAMMAETLARAVHYAHERGIVHRDLKPANVLMVAGKFHPKIADFGLAKKLEDPGLTSSGAIMGTPSYMAPEQARGDTKTIGPAADIYSLGVILYEMLTGRPPFRASSPFETIAQLLAEEPLAPRRLQPKTPRDIETICLKCLQKDPAKRYATAEAFADDLKHFLAGEPITARPVSRFEQALKWALRRPAQAALALAVLLLIVGTVSGLFIWQGFEQRRQKDASSLENARKLDEQERALRLGSLQKEAEADEESALKEVRASQFDKAEKILARASKTLSDSQLADLKTRLEGRRDRAERVGQFYRHIDRAQELAFHEADQEAEGQCQKGVQLLGVLQHRKDWWNHLPGTELDEAQRVKLRRDVEGTVLFWIILRGKQGLAQFSKLDLKRSQESCTQALELMDLVRDAQRWHSLRVIRYLCQRCLDPLKTEPAKPLTDTPHNAYDYYAMGFLHICMAQSMRASELLGDKKGPIVDPAARVLQEWGTSAGLDVKDSQTAFNASEKLLETAGMKEPNYLWAHIWLGKIQSYYSLNAAEMTYSKCLELRPGFDFAYAERAWIRLVWATQVKPEGETAKIRAALEYRCQEDLDSALQHNSHKPYYHYLQGQFYKVKQKLPQALKAWTRAVELEKPLRTLDGRLGDQQIRFAHSMKKLLVDFPDSPERWSLYALACWALDEDTEALAAATKSLLETPQNPHALVVRGAVALKQKQAKEALNDFEAALKQRPRFYHARAGRARALTLLNHHAEALAGYTALREMAEADWQKVEMHLGRARALTALGRTEEARAAQAAADAIMPGSTLQ